MCRRLLFLFRGLCGFGAVSCLYLAVQVWAGAWCMICVANCVPSSVQAEAMLP